jgi:hypothetical protein
MAANALFADRVSAATLRANQLRLYLSVMAYSVVCGLRRLGLHATQLAHAQVGTIRLRLLKLGAQIECPFGRDFGLTVASGISRTGNSQARARVTERTTHPLAFAWILAAMPTVRSILTLILLSGTLRAQTASVKQAQQLATEQYLRTRDYSSLQEQQKRSQEEWLRSDFVHKANNFARLWARFAARSNEKNSFDVDLARKLDKAFTELRKTEGWPAK